MPTAVPRHIAWRQAYAAERYMLSISDSELDLRFADILTNVTILTEDGKLGIAGLEWLEKFTHVHEELAFRGRSFPAITSLGSRAASPSPGAQPLGAKVRETFPDGVPARFTLFKYGHERYLRPLLERGELRLMPASTYGDPSLNVARADNERFFETIHGDRRTQYRINRDFYCFCAAWLHRDRLISDFSANAVLVVNDPHQFFTRLATALEERDYDIRFNRVTYVDPLLVGEEELTQFPFIKHMRFAYQVEHRFVAIPLSKDKNLDPVMLKLDSLQDIAVLHAA